VKGVKLFVQGDQVIKIGLAGGPDGDIAHCLPPA
jgi:hypothetical protein